MGWIDEIEKAKNRNKSRVRAKVDWSCSATVKQNIFGCSYRGLATNACSGLQVRGRRQVLPASVRSRLGLKNVAKYSRSGITVARSANSTQNRSIPSFS